MKNKFLQISLGVTMMLLSAGFLVRSIGSANAIPTPEKFIDQGTSHIGKYMINYIVTPAYKDANGNAYDPTEHIMVWDSETGQSTLYYYSRGWQKCGASAQLPASPMQ